MTTHHAADPLGLTAHVTKGYRSKEEPNALQLVDLITSNVYQVLIRRDRHFQTRPPKQTIIEINGLPYTVSPLEDAERQPRIAYPKRIFSSKNRKNPIERDLVKSLKKSLAPQFEPDHHQIGYPSLTAILKEVVSTYATAAGKLSTSGTFEAIGNALIERAHETTEPLSVKDGWQELLERGVQHKVKVVDGGSFKSTSEVAEILGIKEPAVRRRIRDLKLFAIKHPGTGNYRVPAWTLDSSISGTVTKELIRKFGKDGEWRLWHFMTTPHGRLHGLAPYEVLVSQETLSVDRAVLRINLTKELGHGDAKSLQKKVFQTLDEELDENQNS